jgi:hypothetical protein
MSELREEIFDLLDDQTFMHHGNINEVCDKIEAIIENSKPSDGWISVDGLVLAEWENFSEKARLKYVGGSLCIDMSEFYPLCREGWCVTIKEGIKIRPYPQPPTANDKEVS